MALLRAFLYLLTTVKVAQTQEAYIYTSSPPTFGSNGFANFGAGIWPPSSVGVPLVPQSTDSETLSLLNEMDPARIQSYIQTLVNFGTRHTASTKTSTTTRGIVPARQWLLDEMTTLAEPSNGLMKVSMPCYQQPAVPSSGIPFPVDLCNVQVEITGTIDPNRTYVYTGHYDSRRLNLSDYTGDSPGADDNASAVSIALEMIRILAPYVTENPPPTSIIIAAVAGEEQGLYGMKNASVNVQANFNDDIVGSGSNAPFDSLNQHTIRVFGAGTDYLFLPSDQSSLIDEIIATGYQDDTPSRHLGRYIQEVNAGAASTTEMEVALIYKPDRFSRGGDHESFLEAGYPAVRFTEPQEDFYHQHQDPRTEDGIVYGDDIQFVDFDYTARVGKVNLLCLWSIANAPATPSNFTYDTEIGFLASSQSTPPNYLDNVIKLYWNTEPADPLLDYYEVVWRPLASQQTTELISRIGAKKARMRIDKMFVNSFMGGALISFGCALALSTNAAPWFQTNAPGLIRTISAMVFPVGLIMVVLTDGGTFETGAYKDEALAFAKTKAVTPQWHQIFLKGILCPWYPNLILLYTQTNSSLLAGNWLVCMAVFLAVSSREIISKIVAIWFPVMCFVGLGTDHVIANMYFIPLAIFLGAPAPLTVRYYIWKSMIPSLIGNFIGGGLFTGVIYWYLYLAGTDVPIHFDGIPMDTAVYEQGGPVEHTVTATGAGTGYGHESKNAAQHPVPDSGNHAISGLAKDLHATIFRKGHSESESSA
ncbi:hypothetical protein B7494_g8539 [Chlorociboria aeruginascens]|nr:hypothetical protein B7494_g8539 [Chlorociboria aeruginascens]